MIICQGKTNLKISDYRHYILLNPHWKIVLSSFEIIRSLLSVIFNVPPYIEKRFKCFEFRAKRILNSD